MDLATILGIVSAFSLVIAAIATGGGMLVFWNLPSLLIVVGGTFGATLISFPLGEFANLLRYLKNALFRDRMSLNENIDILVGLVRESRKEGILALENRSNDVAIDSFMRQGLVYLVDGLKAEIIEDILTLDMESTRERHELGAHIFTTMGTIAPAMGLVGTLIGLVQMLQTMDDPASIGPAMAVALLTTFYGAVLANFIFLPLAGKLRRRSQREIFSRRLITEGIVAISRGDNPQVVQYRLESFLPPAWRKGPR
ncbi:MAG: MotA/TolQ/ExbB proton channel family protein [Deltaproteobacteria bacterium]|nr:MotA/TolQ/ExbB proton channel family protein [Deltaproteobacteria bacterium]